jgi:hypothetical protein
MVYRALLPLMRTPRLPVVDCTDAPADLNGLARFAERRNLFSARVPSHFKHSILISFKGWVDPRAIVRSEQLGQWQPNDLLAFSAVLQPSDPAHTPCNAPVNIEIQIQVRLGPPCLLYSGRGFDNPSPFSAEIKHKSVAIPPLPLRAFVAFSRVNLPLPLPAYYINSPPQQMCQLEIKPFLHFLIYVSYNYILQLHHSDVTKTHKVPFLVCLALNM